MSLRLPYSVSNCVACLLYSVRRDVGGTFRRVLSRPAPVEY